MYKLLMDIRTFPETGTIYPFGEYLHFTPKKGKINPEQLKIQLSEKQHQLVEVNEIRAGIEDCFMDLMQQGNVIAREV